MLAYSKQELVEKMQEAAVVLGSVPTANKMDSLKGFPCHHTYLKHFGSWNEALRSSGFRINQEQNIESEIRCMAEAECAYVAGVLDGEGHISVRLNRKRGSYDCAMSISNTCLELLYKLQEFTNGGRVVRHKLKKEREHHTDQYVLEWRVNEMEDLLPQLLPWLVVKRDDAVNLLTYLRNRRKLLKTK